MHVLIAAADVRSAANIKVILAKENLTCETTDLGEDGAQISSLYDYDIILLDLMPADIEGYNMLRRLRAARVHTPILILSACSPLDEKVKFLPLAGQRHLVRRRITLEDRRGCRPGAERERWPGGSRPSRRPR